LDAFEGNPVLDIKVAKKRKSILRKEDE